ncbi:MAG: hypothetical protein Q9166_005280 [cf. Caloplaca sp. 2 TL-2023]
MPTKPPATKTMPCAKGHTTSEPTADGDEYIPQEYDSKGEQKVSPQGHPLGGREYKTRTFCVPGRGDKLFMLATECARILDYRDSWLLFNKNKSLLKIVASLPEKDDLIDQEVLPHSYRMRRIAIITAKSISRQFGSRIIISGRRVRDDYWEAKAIRQGFTDEDLGGEKRPGGTKARESAAAVAASPMHEDVALTQCRSKILRPENITNQANMQGLGVSTHDQPLDSTSERSHAAPDQHERRELTPVSFSKFGPIPMSSSLAGAYEI